MYISVHCNFSVIQTLAGHIGGDTGTDRSYLAHAGFTCIFLFQGHVALEPPGYFVAFLMVTETQMPQKHRDTSLFPRKFLLM